MKYSQTCSCCGQKVTAYTHVLNKSLVSAFGQLVEYYIKHRKPANLQKHLLLSKNQFCNFQKTQYFWITERSKEWRSPTPYWIVFFEGKAPVYQKVATMGRETITFGHPAWHTEKKLPKRVMVREIDPQHKYKQKEYYQNEKGFTLQTLF